MSRQAGVPPGTVSGGSGSGSLGVSGAQSTNGTRTQDSREMGDRRSDSSYDSKIEEANVAMKMDAKTLNQLSSSGKAA